MKLSLKSLLIVLLLFASIQGQSVAKQSIVELNNMASSAVATLQSYDKIGYSHLYNYKHFLAGTNYYKCLDSLRLPTIDFDTLQIQLFTKADQAVDLLFSALENYFTALGNLSDKGLINYDYSKLTDNLEGSDAILKKTGINKDQISTAGKVATKITNFIMTNYREKSIRSVILDYDEDVGKLCDGINSTLNILLGDLHGDFNAIKITYGSLATKKSISDGVRLNAIKDYEKEYAEIQIRILCLKKLQEGIMNIKDGHHQLALGLQNNKLTSSSIKGLLKEKASDYSGIFLQIHKIITK